MSNTEQTTGTPLDSAVLAAGLRDLADSLDNASSTAETAPAGSRKLTVNLPAQLVEDAKNAFWLDRDRYRTFSAWVEAGLREQVEATKRAHGVAGVAPRPGGPLPTGRPLG